MKFKITPEQAETLKEITRRQAAAEATVNVALERFEQIIYDLTENRDSVWEEITTEHNLSDKFNWTIIEIDGEHYVKAIDNITDDQ